MPITPFDTFVTDTFEIDSDLLDNQYIILSGDPILESIQFMVEEENDILFSKYTVLKVTEGNQLLFQGSNIDDSVISWGALNNSSSSSSSQTISELQQLLEDNILQDIQIRYISID